MTRYIATRGHRPGDWSIDPTSDHTPLGDFARSPLCYSDTSNERSRVFGFYAQAKAWLEQRTLELGDAYALDYSKISAMVVRREMGWLFSNENDHGVALPGFFVLLSYEQPKSAFREDLHWFEFEEQAGGMAIENIHAFAHKLEVPENIFSAFCERTDWDREGDRGWRHDLSWRNTPMDSPEDPTVEGYVERLRGLGLTWTPTHGMSGKPCGWKLAQAAYPVDLTEDNLSTLGLRIDLESILGEEPDPSRHALVLLTPNDD